MSGQGNKRVRLIATLPHYIIVLHSYSLPNSGHMRASPCKQVYHVATMEQRMDIVQHLVGGKHDCP